MAAAGGGQARPGRAAPLMAALAGSAALHGVALAALLFWPQPIPEEPGAAGGVALVFADTAELAGGAGAAETPPAPQPPPDATPPPRAAEAPAEPAPPPLPADPASEAPPMAAAEQAAMPPAEPAPSPSDAAPPSPPAPSPDLATPLPPPPAPPAPAAALPPAQTAARAPPAPRPPAPRGAPGPVRLDAGAGALPDPSLGARATGAVVPPGADAGHRNAPPEYPPESRRRGEEGVVRLRLHITAAGQVEQAEVLASSGHPALDGAALAAARRWRFRPATQSGLAVPATLATAVHFRLTDAGGR